MTPIEILFTTLAGLGLFFFGIKTVTRHLAAVAGDGLRRHLHRATANPIGSAGLGVLVGLITQSGRTTSFVLGSLIQAGGLALGRALPVVVWSNLGCALIIFVAVLPIHLVALVTIGVAGACIAFEKPRPFLGTAHITFGLAVMLLGLKMMSSAAPVLSQVEHVDLALSYLHRSPFYAFLIGMSLTIVAQSHMAIILINVPLVAHGLLGFDQSVLLVYGAQAGSSIVTYMTGSHFRGEARQVVVAQILYNAVGVMLFLSIFAADHTVLAGHALLPALTRFTPAADTRVALVVVLFNAVTGLAITLALPAYARLCARLAPSRGDEDLGRPAYLHDEVQDNTGTALLLAEREQLRLLRRLPDYFAYLREPAASRPALSPSDHHPAFASLSGHVRRYHGRLMSRTMTTTDTEWLINQQQRQDVIETMEAACYEYCEFALSNERDESRALIAILAEAIDTCLLTAVSAMADASLDELSVLDRLTSNTGPAMESMRRRYLAASDRVPAEARTQILRLTNLFERATWSVGRLGHLLRQSPARVTDALDAPVPGLPRPGVTAGAGTGSISGAP